MSAHTHFTRGKTVHITTKTGERIIGKFLERRRWCVQVVINGVTRNIAVARIRAMSFLDRSQVKTEKE